MDVSGEAADLMVKEGVQLTEESIKLLAAGGKNLIALLWALAKDNKKLKGKTNMNRLLREERPLVSFPIKRADYKEFAQKAKSFGILFSAVRKKNEAGLVSVVSNVDRLPQINYVLKQMGYPAVQKEEQTAKKEPTRARQESGSSERGNGLIQSKTMDKPSVKESLETLKVASKGVKPAPERVKPRQR